MGHRAGEGGLALTLTLSGFPIKAEITVVVLRTLPTVLKQSEVEERLIYSGRNMKIMNITIKKNLTIRSILEVQKGEAVADVVVLRVYRFGECGHPTLKIQ